MGMYNEVFKNCPYCDNGTGYIQIHQIVLGFGGFHLDNPEQICKDLSEDQIVELFDAIRDGWFACQDCGQTFQLKPGSDDKLPIG